MVCRWTKRAESEEPVAHSIVIVALNKENLLRMLLDRRKNTYEYFFPISPTFGKDSAFDVFGESRRLLFPHLVACRKSGCG